MNGSQPNNPNDSRGLSFLVGLGSTVLVLGLLHWGQPVLMPIALSVLLVFLLNPLVNWLHRRRMPRAPAVLLVVMLVFSLVGGVAWAIGVQLAELANELPEYRGNIRDRIAALRSVGESSPVEKVQQTLKEVAGDVDRELTKEKENGPAPSAPAEEPAPEEEKPVPVVVQGENSVKMFLPSAVGPLAALLATAGLVVVLVIFMLLRLQEIRNRVIRLIGYSRLIATTKAVDEAGTRISNYLLMQSSINATYGLALAIGLYFIGLPYVVLWGFLAALARFIPYVGPWLGATLPILLSLAVFNGWFLPLLVIGLIIVLELGSNMLMEPYLYGQSAGVSEVALLVAIAFWTWIWGPIGLALATPLTVCFVVLCKHIPELKFIVLLMGDQPALEHRYVFYQRLVAGDRLEADQVTAAFTRSQPGDAAFDQLLIPALVFAKLDTAERRLEPHERTFVLKGVRETAENLRLGETGDAERRQTAAALSALLPRHASARALACPASDEEDAIALSILNRVLGIRSGGLEILSPHLLLAETLAQIEQKQPLFVCIGSVWPSDISATRYLCKRLRAHLPDLKIVVGRWGQELSDRQQQRIRKELMEAGATHAGTTLLETRNQIVQMTQILASHPPRAVELAEPSAAEPEPVT